MSKPTLTTGHAALDMPESARKIWNKFLWDMAFRENSLFWSNEHEYAVEVLDIWLNGYATGLPENDPALDTLYQCDKMWLERAVEDYIGHKLY